MSLYTFSPKDRFPVLKQIPGLHIEVSTNVALLAQMGNIEEEDVIDRLINNNLAFVARLYGQPAAFGWVARKNVRIGELNHSFTLPASNRYLWNFRTLQRYRGLGIYPHLLQYIMQYEADKAKHFWIIHAPENKASLKGIQKAGFRYTGKLYVRPDGMPGFEPASVSITERELIETMDFHITEEPAASCWNCSSPYLKRKEESCCCNMEGAVCVA